MNLEPLSLSGELLLQPLLALLALTLAYSRHKGESRKVVGCLTAALAVVGAFLLLWTTVQVAANFDFYLTSEFARQLALTVWLPFVLFPFLYFVAVLSAIELILMRARVMRSNAPLRVKFGVIVGLRFSIRFAKALRGAHSHILEEGTFRATLSAMKDFRAGVRRREQRERQRRADLVSLRGVAGEDEDGAQLDRREFHETKNVLKYIGGMQAGQLSRRGGRFWDDQTDAAVGDKLPAPHGVSVETSRDQKRWRAWRRLPSGFVLGIGGISRTEEFEYAGFDVPAGWPGEAPEWVQISDSATPPDWARDDAPLA